MVVNLGLFFFTWNKVLKLMSCAVAYVISFFLSLVLRLIFYC